jgi:hypothetical protein
MSTVGGGVNIVKDGLVLYLDAANSKSYISGSTTWSDMSGNGNNGTLVNGPGYSSQNGGSIVFDGSNDYVNCGNILNFERTNSFSISCWVNMTSLASIGAFFTKTQGAPAYTGYYFGHETTGDLTFILRNTFSTNQLLVRTPTGQLIANRWNNIVVTYSGNSLETGISFYTNSNLQPNIVGSSNLTNTILTSANVNIGARVANTVSPAHLNGSISQTQIYNRALSDQEVLQNYNATKTRFNLT